MLSLTGIPAGSMNWLQCLPVNRDENYGESDTSEKCPLHLEVEQVERYGYLEWQAPELMETGAEVDRLKRRRQNTRVIQNPSTAILDETGKNLTMSITI